MIEHLTMLHGMITDHQLKLLFDSEKILNNVSSIEHHEAMLVFSSTLHSFADNAELLYRVSLRNLVTSIGITFTEDATFEHYVEFLTAYMLLDEEANTETMRPLLDNDPAEAIAEIVSMLSESKRTSFLEWLELITTVDAAVMVNLTRLVGEEDLVEGIQEASMAIIAKLRDLYAVMSNDTDAHIMFEYVKSYSLLPVSKTAALMLLTDEESSMLAMVNELVVLYVASGDGIDTIRDSVLDKLVENGAAFISTAALARLDVLLGVLGNDSI